jgi:hypothetical protein
VYTCAVEKSFVIPQGSYFYAHHLLFIMTLEDDNNEQASITEEIIIDDDIDQTKNNKNNNTKRNPRPDILLEGWMLKQSRNHYWQDRYLVFKSDQTLSYRKKPEDGKPRAVFRISRDAGCEISDIFLEKTRSAIYHRGNNNNTSSANSNNRNPGDHNNATNAMSNLGRELLYCVTVSWPDETGDTVASYSKSGLNESLASLPVGVGNNTSDRPLSPSSIQNSLRSPKSWRKKPKESPRLRQTQSDTGSRHSADESSLESGGHSIPGGAYSKGKKKTSSLLQKIHSRAHSATDVSKNNDFNGEASISSLLDQPSTKTPTARKLQFGRSNPPSAIDALGASMPNIKVGEYKSPMFSRMGISYKKKRDTAGVPIEVELDDDDDNSICDHRPDRLMEVFEGNEYHDEQEDCVDDALENLQTSDTERIGNLGQTLAEEYGVEKKPTFEDRYLVEQEKLHHQFLNKQRKRRSDTTKRVIGVTKIAVAAGAAVGVGVITAGVGLAAGLVFLGGAAAIGGTAGVAEAGLKRSFKKKASLTIATTNYELAKLWKSTLDACLEQESLTQSTWGQRYMADGRKPTRLIINVLSGDEDDVHASRGSPSEHPKGQANLFLRDPNFFAQARAKWRPLEGGWVSFLGPGAQSLRVFKEERIQIDDKSQKVAPLAVGGSTCTPLRTQVVLNAHPTEAFMCIMSYARIHASNVGDALSPNSGQLSSYRLIEKIDDHTDVLHLVLRKLFLFPSWTEARDFVLLRYWRYESDGSYIICYESMEHPDCPPQPGFVRGEMHQVYTIAPPKINDYRQKGTYGTECMLTSVVQVDPKGWVPTKPIVFLSNQTYADAFGIIALLQTLDIRDAIETDRFLNLSPDLQYQVPSSGKSGSLSTPSQEDYDLRFVNRERCDSFTSEKFPDIGSHPEPLSSEKWAEPDANSFMVRGPGYKSDRIKINAGTSIGQLIAVDVVLVDKPIYSGMSTHPTERIQLALQREKRMKQSGRQSDMPPFIFVVNIILPGPPFYHGVFYYAVDDMSTIDGTNETPSSKLCHRFLFGKSDTFRDLTFKLIPRIVEGNFLVRKAVGNTPAIMGTKLKQYYVRNERFMEVILDCGSSPVATGVIRLSLGYAKTLVVDMCFLLEADDDEYLPERVFGAVRMKYPSFGTSLRKVEDPINLRGEKYG